MNDEEDEEELLMATRTLKELATPDVPRQTLGIVFPELEKPLKSNSGFLNLVPKFNGLLGEDPHMHLKEFLVVYSTMRPDRVDEDQVKLRAFPFSLHNLAKEWLYNLPPGTITTWTKLQRYFLEKFSLLVELALLENKFVGLVKT